MSFSRLMASLRQEFSIEKQLYRLVGIPQVLNVWMFELCSNVEPKVAVKEGNNIPRILNWKVAAVRPQFNQFITRMFSKSRQECDPSNAVVDDAEPTSTDSVVKETDKSVEMEDDKANQTPSFSKKDEQHEKDVGIEKQSDIAVEEIQPLESIIPGQEHDLALTIYKPPPTTSAEYEIGDTAILSAFSMPQKNVSANKNAPTPPSRKPSKIYRSHFLTHFGSSSKGKKKLASKERKKNSHSKHRDVIMYYLRKKYKNTIFSISRYTTTDYFFKVYIDKAYVNYYNSDVSKDLATQDVSSRTDEVADMEKSLISTIKGLSTCAECRDCGVFVAVYAEYLSEELGISFLGIDAQYHRLRYAYLLCKYGSEKVDNRYFSENEDPPRPRSKFAQKKQTVFSILSSCLYVFLLDITKLGS
ncbi:hypothetical protein CQW23_12682 [Capsicum baccatum]|uniref:Ubiquitin-like protease family profile domain-containing protein n=1 Tax=Capsicum baccatum TaxID=33114 RepID=A0A2G2WTB0_CAPBA|nr:hypothetical protein CQW23_12682 [Capsicum baccatum]